MYVDANGIRINYRLDGWQGSPWVTFITGIANDTTMWDGQIPALEDEFNILRLDTRGHGGTEATDGDYAFDMLMNDVVGVWDALDIPQTHVVGLGLGGSTSIGIAINHSDRVISLTPCACRAVMVPELQAIWPSLVEMAKTGGMEAVAETTVQRWFTDEFKAANPDVLYSVRQQILGTDLQGYFGCIAAFMSLNFIDKIGDITVPTLFISGADDQRGGPAPVMQSLADGVNGARHVSIPDAAHICNIQNPAGFNDVLGTFLRSH
tara:strand:+ start:1757 stop:2548 length:792 start_codon:yes stop_codon:yes gene_type:complete